MKPFVNHTGIAVPFMRNDVDTDQIIPKQFLKKIERSGFGKHLFHDWRFLDEEGLKQNPDFILNQNPYDKGSILIGGKNFGCGSSREHAPWALEDFGFRCIIAPSFADIFYNNCFKNGMLPVILKDSEVTKLNKILEENPGMEMEIDLPNQKIHAGEVIIAFDIDSFRKECLINGWDDIGLSLRYENEIDDFEKRYSEKHPYLQSMIS
ncbi:MAG: 3-isopropylmalate dehydratase small subunit [Spirochaetia bacterium]|nr:3-isopropylmalate dehydratase small subunit [Spirochaetia bacterium]